MNLAFGICAGVASSACTSLGMVTHRIFINRHNPPGASLLPLRVNAVWLVGVTFFLSAVLLDALALVFAPVAIVGALSVTNLIFNTLFAHMCVGEAATITSCASVLLMMTGCFVVMSSHVTADALESHPDDLGDALVFVREWRRSVSVITTTTATSLVPVLANRIEDSHKGVLYAISAGVNATNCLLVGKLVMILLQCTSVEAVDELEWWITIVALIVLGVVNIFLQLTYILRSLSVISTVLVSNIFTSCSVISSIVFAGVVLDEFASYKVEQWLFLFTGTLVTVFGVFLLKDSTSSVSAGRETRDIISSPDAL